MKITTAKSDEKNARTITVEKELGSNLNESAKLFGEKIVHSYFIAAAKVAIQGISRRLLKADKTDKEILKAVADYTPGIKKAGKTKLEKAEEGWASLSSEEQAAFKKKFGIK